MRTIPTFEFTVLLEPDISEEISVPLNIEVEFVRSNISVNIRYYLVESMYLIYKAVQQENDA